MHDFLTGRGIRSDSSISLVMPLGAPIPPSPAASEALLAAFDERGIEWHPDRLVERLDAERKVALFSDGGEMPFDLFLGVPRHRVPDVVVASGMTVDGWIPVDPETLATRFADVYAIGDVTSVGTPKAGVFAEGQASVVARSAHRPAPRSVGRRVVRRPRHLLPRVRSRLRREGRRHVRERPRHPSEASRDHPSSSPPKRRSSVPAGSNGGSTEPGRSTGSELAGSIQPASSA